MRTLITGGSGFLGRGLLRRVYVKGTLDWDVTVYSRDETKQEQCREQYPEARYVLGDVRDRERLANAMDGMDLVVHAAAVKYIPEAEMNCAEAIAVNVDGSRTVIEAAKTAGVKSVVGISTDKAVRPVNCYGASKMVLERLFADEAAARPYSRATRFNTVRYGNVVGSTGSVIPLFQKQYAQHKKVRITDMRMTRFWMSVEEAIDLILFAMFSTGTGSTFVPMARAMTIYDVAQAATVNDVSADEIGQRPGEKLHEELIQFEESVRLLYHDGCMELRPPGQQVAGTDPSTLTSQFPHYRLSVVQMRELIADAETI
jgi:UDP-N-acetylglucosamine 4,6-dehydratase/5-epimerase